MSESGRTISVDRRRFLATGLSGLAVAGSGCVDEVRSVITGDASTLSISITTVPADDDRASISLARRLERRLESVGVSVSLDVRSQSSFLRTVLIDHDFDLYVGRHPGGHDPDFLYETLHSVYANEVGWQNPFGFTNVTFDELLRRQRGAAASERRAAVSELLHAFVREKPFVPLCVPDEYRLVRTDRYGGLADGHLATPQAYLGVEPSGPDHAAQLRSIVTDSRPSINLNPFASEYRIHGPVPGLLYDSLAVLSDGEYRPWLAESWRWSDDDADGGSPAEVDDDPVPRRIARGSVDGPSAEITIREDCRFHDGEPLTASDVGFTYEFLADTSLGRAEAPVPPTRYRGLGAAVESVDVLDDRTIVVSFAAGTPVAKRALTVPILPEHLWRDAVESTPADDFPTRQGRWNLLASRDVSAVGSGPYVYADSAERDHLRLERFDDHFTRREDVDLPGPTVAELEFLVDPSSASAVQHVESGPVDVTTSPIEPYAYGDAEAVGNADLVESPSWTFYHVGFNVRRPPFRNPYVRRTIARLLDPESIVDEVFDGHASPVSVPVQEEWIPAELEWSGEDPVSPFLGSDGELDVEAARRAFEAIGFRYDEDGRFVVGN